MVQNGEFSLIDKFFTHAAFGAWHSKGGGMTAPLSTREPGALR